MMPVTAADLLPIEEFVAKRPALQREAMAATGVRRLAVGPNMTLLFENRQTVWWQVQEMCRVEQIRAPAAVQHELDTYNALLGTPDELSATLLVEYPEPVERDRMLKALVGLHDHVWMEVGGTRIAGRFDGEQFNDQRISSVQFVRFLLGTWRAAFLDFQQSVVVVVDHPAYSVRVGVTGALRGALTEDLS